MKVAALRDGLHSALSPACCLSPRIMSRTCDDLCHVSLAGRLLPVLLSLLLLFVWWC